MSRHPGAPQTTAHACARTDAEHGAGPGWAGLRQRQPWAAVVGRCYLSRAGKHTLFADKAWGWPGSELGEGSLEAGTVAGSQPLAGALEAGV